MVGVGPVEGSTGVSLGNTASQPLAWSGVANSPWLSIVPSSGVVNPGESAEVSVGFLGNRASDPREGSISFTTVDSGASVQHLLVLQGGNSPGLPVEPATAQQVEGGMVPFTVTPGLSTADWRPSAS